MTLSHFSPQMVRFLLDHCMVSVASATQPFDGPLAVATFDAFGHKGAPPILLFRFRSPLL